MTEVRILILDIETAPNLAYVWKFFKENISPKQVLEHTTILSFAAKWLHSPTTLYHDCRGVLEERDILLALKMLLDRADIVVAHNGAKFDLPTISGRFLVNGIMPPSPFKIVDTYLAARKWFNFPSNSLEYLAEVFSLDVKKQSHSLYPGFELWKGVLIGDEDAWEEMRRYNIQDVEVLEALYFKMRPYIKNHPNIGVYLEREIACCSKCGSTNIHYRGYYKTSVGKYRRFVCNDCGGWSKTRFTELGKNINKTLLTSAR